MWARTAAARDRRRPVERHAPDRERLRAMARRFGYGTLVAIAVLLATGRAMASRFGL